MTEFLITLIVVHLILIFNHNTRTRRHVPAPFAGPGDVREVHMSIYDGRKIRIPEPRPGYINPAAARLGVCSTPAGKTGI